MRLRVGKNIFRTSAHEQMALLWATAIISIITLIVVLDNRSAQKAAISYFGDQSVGVAGVAGVAHASDQSYWTSFGDLFSSDAHLDAYQTDMKLDDRTTALVFPPVYELVNKTPCSDISCGLSNAQLVSENKASVSSSLASLPRPLPVGVIERQVVFADLVEVGRQKIALFIVQEDGEERGLVYFLNGTVYSPLIAFDTSQEIKTKYGRGGGQLAVGGDSEEFLVVYAGYEGKAFHYHQGTLDDISRFFGLRVADGGFHPYIIKQGEGSNALWYVLSLSSNKNKLLKLWQNNSQQILGAYDFSDEISREFNGGIIKAIASSDNRGELNFVVENIPGMADSRNLWIFKDKGFDNSKNRIAVSKNIDNKNLPVLQAYVKSLGVALGASSSGYQESFPRPDLKIYLSNSANRFLLANPGQIIKFSEAGQELYWKIEFIASTNQEYSPWLDHINDLQYLVSP